MGVESYVEVFTLLIGWHLYNVIWDVLSSTGIVYLPFLGILIDHWRDGFISGGERNGAATTLRSLEIDLYLAFTVVVLACVPNGFTTLERGAVTFTPLATTAEPRPTTVTGASSGSTFQSALSVTPPKVNVPVWWYSVMALSSGVTRAIIAGSGLSLDNFRLLSDVAGEASIDDSRLRAEAQRFRDECFVPARTAYLKSVPSAAAAGAIATHGPADPEWMGSHAFLADPKLYASMHAATEVPGWPFDAARDKDMAGAGTVPAFGRPTCKEWWEGDGTTDGLQKRFNDQLRTFSRLEDLVGTFGPHLTDARRQTW
jgi:hypothetical protein